MTDAELVYAFRAGNEAAFEELLHRNRGMIRMVAGRYFAIGWSYEDFLLEAEIGVWEATLNWNGIGSFGNWARFVVKRKMITLVKFSTTQKNKPLRGHSDLFSPILKEAVSCGLGGTIEDPLERIVREEVTQETVKSLMSVLTELEAAVLIEKIKDKSYEEIAEELGIPRKGVDNSLQRAKKKFVRAKERSECR